MVFLLALAGCGSITSGQRPEPAPEPGLFGERGISLMNLGAANANANAGGGGGIGVNTYLWRASLDTLSFMPLASADPFGGVIITDWYAPPATAGTERFKLTVFILDMNLRADGIKVAVFRQENAGGGAWLDAAVDPATATELEDTILTRARQMLVDAGAAP